MPNLPPRLPLRHALHGYGVLAHLPGGMAFPWWLPSQQRLHKHGAWVKTPVDAALPPFSPLLDHAETASPCLPACGISSMTPRLRASLAGTVFHVGEFSFGSGTVLVTRQRCMTGTNILGMPAQPPMCHALGFLHSSAAHLCCVGRRTDRRNNLIAWHVFVVWTKSSPTP